MTDLDAMYDDHGARFTEVGGRQVPDHFGRPERAHLAVRNGVGVTERPVDVVEVSGDDRIEYLDNVLTNRVPETPGEGTYALLLDPQGKVRLDLYLYVRDDRVTVLLPPGDAPELIDEWREKVFIQDVGFEILTDQRTVLGVHGPQATEKLASVTTGGDLPAERYAAVDATVGETDATVIAGDELAGEEQFEVICDAATAPNVLDTLLTRGVGAAPFGYRTWLSLTLEAGTPLLDPDFRGSIPNVFGLRTALDFEKGCYVGQEVVSRVENRGRPSRRVVGLRPEVVPESGAAVFDGDEAIGEVTRAAHSPTLEGPIALALVPFEHEAEHVSVRANGEDVPATRAELPFYTGSGRSVRIPSY